MSDGVFLRLLHAIRSAPGVEVVGSTMTQPYGVLRRFYLFDGATDVQLLSISVREDDAGFWCSFNGAMSKKFGLDLGQLLGEVKQAVGNVVRGGARMQ